MRNVLKRVFEFLSFIFRAIFSLLKYGRFCIQQRTGEPDCAPDSDANQWGFNREVSWEEEVAWGQNPWGRGQASDKNGDFSSRSHPNIN